MAETLTQRTAWSALAGATSAFGRLASAILLARILEPELAGRFVFLVWLVEMAVLVTSFGLPNTLTRFLSRLPAAERPDEALSLKRSTLGLVAVALPLGGAGLFVLLDRYAGPLDPATTFTLLLIFVCQAMSGFVSSILAGEQRYRTLALVNAISVFGLLVTQPVLGLWLSLPGALVGVLVAYVVPLLVVLRQIGPSLFRRPRAAPSREFLRQTTFTWLALVLSAVVWNRTEIAFLERLSSDAEIAYFGVGLTMTSFTTVVATLMTSALMPHFSAKFGASADVQGDYRHLTSALALVTYPITAALFVFMPQIVPLLYGESYAPAITTTMTIVLTGLLSFAGVGSTLQYAAGNTGFLLATNILGAVLLSASCYILIGPYGSIGAAVARLAVQAFIVLIQTLHLRYALKVCLPLRNLGLALTASSAAAGPSAAVVWCLGDAGLLLGIGMFPLIYLLCVRKLRPLDTATESAFLRAATNLPRPMARPVVALLVFIFPEKH